MERVALIKSIPLNTTETLALAAAIFIGYRVIKKTSDAKCLVFFPTSVTDVHIEGPATPVMTIGIQVQNPTNSKFTVNSFAGNVYTNNIFVGNVSNFSGFIVQPNSQSVFYLTARLQAIPLVNDIINAFTNQHFSQDIEVDANISVESVPIGIKLSYHVGL